MKKLLSLALLVLLACRAIATESNDLDVLLLHRGSRKPCPGVRLIVFSIHEPVSAVTNEHGRCRLSYGFSISANGTDGKAIYAVRRPGDTVLVKRFTREPRTFEKVEDQHYRTVLYLP